MTGIFPISGVAPGLATNSLAAPSLATGCTALWYANKCSPRLDPAAMNAIMSEIINVSNCANLVYDCNVLNNLCTGIVQIIRNTIFTCLPTAPDIATGSCQVVPLVWSTDATGCTKIAQYTKAASQVGVLTMQFIYGNAQSSLPIPVNPLDTTSFYNVAEMVIAIAANSVNPTKINNVRVMANQINIACAGQYNISAIFNPLFNPTTNGGAGAAARLGIRVDGIVLTSGGFPVAFAPFTNFDSGVSGDVTIFLAAGLHQIELFVIADGAALPPAQVNVLTIGATVSNGAATVTLEPL